MHGSAFSIRIGSHTSGCALRLRDGGPLSTDDIALVVNRLSHVPVQDDGSRPSDALYRSEEWRAFLAAWLRAVPCPVLNPPRAASLSGPAFHTPLWRAVASRHGLRTRAWSSGGREADAGSSVHFVCLGTRHFGAAVRPPAAVIESTARMARHVGAPLLGVTFDLVGDDWIFVDATPAPSLMRAGEPLVDALLERASRRRTSA